MAKFGHNLEAIFKHADVAVDWNACNFHDQLIAGISLNKGTMKYILHKEKNSNGFLIYVRALKITWSEDPRYWKWIIEKISPCGSKSIEVAQLLKVWWLDVRGTISISFLSPNVVYEVVFVVMIKKDGCGWNIPVNLELKLPHETIHNKVCLLEYEREKWVEIKVGTFNLSDNDVCGCGEIQFGLYEHGDNNPKSGLVVKCAEIRPIAKPLCGA